MQTRTLKKGSVYFGLSFENDNSSRLMVNSYEYIGLNIEKSDRDRYFFRLLGSEDTIEMTERQLDLVLDLDDLVEQLKQWREGKLILHNK